MNILKLSKAHPSAECVYKEVRKVIPNISLGTVYRNIKLLQSIGEVSEVSREGGEGRFDGNTVPHYHVTCQNCGEIRDVDGIVLQDIEKKAAAATGFRVTNHCIGFKGICPECSGQV